MGSGKGRIRRAQVAVAVSSTQETTLSSGVSYSMRAWQKFVYENELGKMKLYRYYLGGTPKDCGVAEHEKVITELFKDMVAVGAINLPEPHQASEFVFRMAELKSWDRQVSIALKDEPQQGVRFSDIAYCFDERQVSAHSDVSYALYQISRALNILIGE